MIYLGHDEDTGEVEEVEVEEEEEQEEEAAWVGEKDEVEEVLVREEEEEEEEGWGLSPHLFLFSEQAFVLVPVAPQLLGQLHASVAGLGQVLGQDVLMGLGGRRLG